MSDDLDTLKAALAGKPGELDAWLEAHYEGEVGDAIRWLLEDRVQDTRYACAAAVENLSLDDYSDGMKPYLSQLQTRALVAVLEAKVV